MGVLLLPLVVIAAVVAWRQVSRPQGGGWAGVAVAGLLALTVLQLVVTSASVAAGRKRRREQ
jgi:hypothetical protein